MADVHDQATRSYNMSRIKGKNTKPEIKLRKCLHSLGFRYRIHAKNLPGTPDLVLPKYNTVINVNGCFWHGHEDCKYFKLPETRKEWWRVKIEKTKIRDRHNEKLLIEQGWNVITVYECQLKNKILPDTLSAVEDELMSREKLKP